MRHDLASDPLYFEGAVVADGAATPFAPNTDQQTTLTLGFTAGF